VLFTRQVETRHALIQQTLADYEECLLAMRVLMTHGGAVEQEKFSRVARAQLARFPGFLGVQWAPRVPAAARAGWEQINAAVLGGLGRVRERAGGGPDAVAGERADYFPILFVEPLAQNRHVIGTDAAASPLRDVFATAAASRSPAMSGVLKLVYETGPNDGVILACPVWDEAEEATGTGEPRGFLLGVFRVADLLVQPWNRVPSSQLDVMFIDESVTRPDRRVLYGHLADGWGGLPTEEDFRRAPHRRMSLLIPGRTWSVLYRRGAERIYGGSVLPAVALGAGLVVTALASSLLLLQIRRARTVERLVQERTAELSESRRQLDALMQAIPGIVFRGVYRDILYLNFVSAGVKELSGYDAAELLAGGVRWRDLVHPEDLLWVRSRTRAAIEQGRDFQVEYRIRTRAGGQKWMLARGRGLKPADGSPPVVEGLAIDITAQKEAETGRLALERKLLEGQKLESLGLLAGGLAHDFNNLLSTMLGNAELGQLTVPAGHTAGAKFRAIETAATHAAELCRQLLSYAGKGPVDRGAPRFVRADRGHAAAAQGLGLPPGAAAAGAEPGTAAGGGGSDPNPPDCDEPGHECHRRPAAGGRVTS
jgi:two-component system cell cycle sensor histidine kinase/response regulator CckA